MVSLALVLPPSSCHASREGVARANGKRADRLCLTFIRSSSWSTSREQQPSVTRSRCHRPSASERPRSITGAVRVRKGRHHARGGIRCLHQHPRTGITGYLTATVHSQEKKKKSTFPSSLHQGYIFCTLNRIENT